MIKVAMIGAGSVVFSRNLTGDILSYPEFHNAHFSYMDIDPRRLETGSRLCARIAAGAKVNPTIEATLHQRKALEGADFVINMVQVGGFSATLVDFEIPRKYGLNFTIADTTGPGGIFRALRSYPMLVDLCRDMAEVCPNAILLNYANPMSMNMRTIAHHGHASRAVGLCHSVQGTFEHLMWYLGEKPEDVAFICAGINHMAFYLELKKNGVDLYPKLFTAMDRPDVYNSNRVRFELMRRLGYFVTESSEHNAEYNAWFMPHGQETIQAFAIPVDEYLRRCDESARTFAELEHEATLATPLNHQRSHEYGAAVIHSVATGCPRVVYGNMPNHGAISNLPNQAIVETPTLVDRGGPRLTTVGELPPQLLGYIQPHLIQHELFLRAVVEGRRDHIYQAAMYDPLTAAMLSPDKIVDMCDELIEAHGDLLPPLNSRTLVPTSGKIFKPLKGAELKRVRQSRA